jgi:hypothetical protein
MDPNAVANLIQTLAAGGVAARVVHLNLEKRFPALLAYVGFLAVINLGFGLLNPVSALYFWSYIAVEPLKCVFSILAVRELFSLTFHDYPGIRSFGRWVTYAGVALALGVSLALTRLFWNGGAAGRAHSHLFYLHVAQRSVVFTLAAVIVTILWFLSKYPLHLSRSTLVSSAFFSLLFLGEAMRLLLDSLAPHLYNLSADWAQSIFTSACLGMWAVLLSPETLRETTQIRFSHVREEYLLQQLTSLNQMMTRAARR